MIIPYYRENGFQLDFEKTAPVDYDNLAMYIHPRIKIIFKDIWSPESTSKFSIGHILENGEDFDCDDFKGRMEEFIEFEEARVSRVFKKRRKSIFFDEEEVSLLANIFSKEKFTAIVEISINDKTVPIEKIPDNLYKIVKPFLSGYEACEMLNIEEYRRFKNVRKAITKRRVNVNMDKKTNIIGIALGVVCAGIGVAITIGSSIVINENIQDIRGRVTEVEIID